MIPYHLPFAQKSRRNLVVVVLFVVSVLAVKLSIHQTWTLINRGTDAATPRRTEWALDENARPTSLQLSTPPRINMYRSQARRCDRQSIESLKQKEWLKSQSGEDEHLLGYMNGMCGGTYIEMGALDGVRYSNTYGLNKAFDWKGLLIELSPISYAKLEMNRPNEINLVHAAVCNERQKVHFYDGNGAVAVAGVWEFASLEYRDRWWKHASLDQTKEVDCNPLSDIIDRHGKGTSFFDFFSLDVEGAELAVLQSLDFSKVGFGIIVVEAHKTEIAKNLAIQSLLVKNGYIFLYRIHQNLWFANEDFSTIYDF